MTGSLSTRRDDVTIRRPSEETHVFPFLFDSGPRDKKYSEDAANLVGDGLFFSNRNYRNDSKLISIKGGNCSSCVAACIWVAGAKSELSNAINPTATAAW